MPRPFLPDPIFAWTFYLVLVGITAVAAYIDLRRMVIPKWLSVPTLGLGVLFNVVRGGRMAFDLNDLWVLDYHGGWMIGALDGFLFALAGFGVAFGLYFVLWILGTCGAGDVKLCAALGAWVGPLWSLYLLVVTMLCLIAFGVARLVWSQLTRGSQATKKDFYASQARRGPKSKQPEGREGKLVPRKRLVTFSLPVAAATAIVLLWVCRVELGLAEPRTPARTTLNHPGTYANV